MKVFALKSPVQSFASYDVAAGSNIGWRRCWTLLALLGATFLVVLPIILYGSPTGADLPNHYRFASVFYDALRTGHLYPNWVACSNWGYGDPSVRFYPPALYYLMAAARALTGDWYAATLPVFTVLTFLGVSGAYFWARSFVPPRYAIWAGVFYAIAPYRLNESLENFILAEYAGGAALAFAFGFVERICRERRWRDVAGLGAAYAVLILTHLPLAVMGSLMLGLYALLRIERGKMRLTIGRLSAGVLLGLAASARYWVMMITEMRWIKVASGATTEWYDYNNNFLFTDFSYNTAIWWTNYIALASIVMFVPLVVLLRHRKARGLKALSIVALLSFIMTTRLSKPLWVIIPKLKEVQFPWRWLAVTSLVCSVLMAVCFPVWVEKLRGNNPKLWRKLALVAAGCVLLSTCFLATHFMERGYYFNRKQLYTEIESFDGAPGHELWRPVWSGKALPDRMERPISVEGRDVNVIAWEAERGTFQVTSGDATEARMRAFYYPDWSATTSDGQPLPVRAASDGVLLISLPPRAVSVEVKFYNPIQVQLAAFLSVIGWLSIGGLSIFSLRKGNKL